MNRITLRRFTIYDTIIHVLLPPLQTASETVMADKGDVRHGKDFGGSNEQLEDQGVREEEGEEAGSATQPNSSLAIEYDPAMLEYNDPLASMKPDVYTDTV